MGDLNLKCAIITAMNSPLIIAHRGLHYHHPENSLPALEAAVESGFGVEFDVRFLKNGEIVVHHDPDLMRSCGRDVLLTDVDAYDEIRDLKLLDGHGNSSELGIPLLASALKAIPVSTEIRLEIKLDALGPSVPKAITKLLSLVGMKRVETLVFISFNPQAIRSVQHLSNYECKYIVGSNSDSHLPHWKHQALFSPVARWYAQADGISCDWQVADRFAGLPNLECWTVDSHSALKIALRAGAMSVTSNKPDFILSLL